MGLETGWVYVLSNVEQFNTELRVKIGYGQDPYVRQDDLDTTGVSHPFKVEYAALVMNPRKIEQAVHAALNSFRCRKEREFFDCGVVVAVDRIKKEAPKIYEERIHFAENPESEEMAEVIRLKDLQGFGRIVFKKIERYEDHNPEERFHGYLKGVGKWFYGSDPDPDCCCVDQLEIDGYRDAWKDFEKLTGGSKSKRESHKDKWQDFLKAGSEISGTRIFSSGFGKASHFELLKDWINEDFQTQIHVLIEKDRANREAAELKARLAKEYADKELRDWKREEDARIASIDLENALALGNQKAINKARKALALTGAMSVSQKFSKVISQNTTAPIYSNTPSNALLSSMRNAAENGYERYLQRTIEERESYQSKYEQIEPIKKVAPTVTYKRKLATENDPGKVSPDKVKDPVSSSEPNPHVTSSVLHHYWHIGFVKGVSDKDSGIVTSRSNLCVYVCKWQNAETHDEMNAFVDGYNVGFSATSST